MRIIIFALLGYLLYRILRSFFTSGKKLKKSMSGGPIDEMVQDPSCQTYIPLRDAQRKIISGKEYFFCSKECAEKFENEIKQKKQDRS
jgi:YHS domain-containing protein